MACIGNPEPFDVSGGRWPAGEVQPGTPVAGAVSCGGTERGVVVEPAVGSHRPEAGFDDAEEFLQYVAIDVVFVHVSERIIGEEHRDGKRDSGDNQQHDQSLKDPTLG